MFVVASDSLLEAIQFDPADADSIAAIRCLEGVQSVLYSEYSDTYSLRVNDRVLGIYAGQWAVKAPACGVYVVPDNLFSRLYKPFHLGDVGRAGDIVAETADRFDRLNVEVKKLASALHVSKDAGITMVHDAEARKILVRRGDTTAELGDLFKQLFKSYFDSKVAEGLTPYEASKQLQTSDLLSDAYVAYLSYMYYVNLDFEVDKTFPGPYANSSSIPQELVDRARDNKES